MRRLRLCGCVNYTSCGRGVSFHFVHIDIEVFPEVGGIDLSIEEQKFPTMRGISYYYIFFHMTRFEPLEVY